MTVDPATAAGSAVHAGTTYHFCSRHCLEKFEADPTKYVAKSAAAGGPSSRPTAAERPPTLAVPATMYTCPMHPEVVRDGPGMCPKCGMALEPMTPRAGDEDDPELRDMTRRFVVATALTLPVFVLAMAPMIPGVSYTHRLTGVTDWVGLVLSTPVVFWAGWPFFVRARQALAHRTANMFTLIALGVAAAWAFSVAATAAPELFPAGFRGDHGVPTYFESGPRSSSPSCCSARCSNSAPGGRPARRSAPCWG